MKTIYKAAIAIVMVVVAVPFSLFILYFPFEPNLPGSNVDIENLTWTNVTRINETTYRVSLSEDIIYRYKESWMHTNGNIPLLPDELPVRIRVLAGPLGGGVPYKYREVPFSENITLQYRHTYPYNSTFDLKAGKNYGIIVEAHWKEYFTTPHPYFGEWRWELLGGGATAINLTQGEMPLDHELSEVDKGDAIAIAFKDERVREEIRDKEYEVGDVSKTQIEIVGPEANFSGEVPVVPIKIGNVTLMVSVDIEQGKVINIGHQWEKPLLNPPPASED